MSNLKKIQKPKINANLDIISTLDELLQLIEDDEKIYDKLIENMDISNLDESRVSFDSCIFRNVTFDNCTFRYIDLLDVSFEKCDLSNIDFSEGSILNITVEKMNIQKYPIICAKQNHLQKIAPLSSKY